jgi:hypothetical protein
MKENPLNNPKYESTGRVVALAVAFFGGLALLAYAGGVFQRLGPELTVMLGAFAIAFAALTYQLDAGVRAYVKRLVAPRAAVRKPGSPAAV